MSGDFEQFEIDIQVGLVEPLAREEHLHALDGTEPLFFEKRPSPLEAHGRKQGAAENRLSRGAAVVGPLRKLDQLRRLLGYCGFRFGLRGKRQRFLRASPFGSLDGAGLDGFQFGEQGIGSGASAVCLGLGGGFGRFGVHCAIS